MKKFIVLVGPSAVGKTTIGLELRKQLGAVEAVSHTTRQPRPGECQGDPYHFVSLRDFNLLDKIEEVEYAGNHYCLSRNEMERRGQAPEPFYVIVDIHGLHALEEAYGRDAAVSVFVQCSPETAMQRIVARGDNPEIIARRMTQAIEDGEFENWRYTRYSVSNEGNLSDAVADVIRIAQKEGIC